MSTRPSKINSLLAGSLAGTIETTTVWPMENIKTQLQLYPDRQKAPFKGIFSCARYNIKHSGIGSLYRGLAPILLATFPKAGIRFASQSYYRDWFGTSNLGIFSSGVMAGITESVLVTTPAETIKTRVINQQQRLLPGLVHIYRTGGMSGFYRGLIPTSLKAASNQGTRFLVYGQYKGHIETTGKFTSQNAFLGGMLAGGISVLLNNPFDVIKTQIQANTHLNSLPDTAKHLYRKHGLGFTTLGINARLARVVPGQGVLFLTYDSIFNWLDGVNTNQ